MATGLQFFGGAGGVGLTYSTDGTMLYLTGSSVASELQIRRLTESGALELGKETHNYRGPALSPDGMRLAVDFRSGEGNQRDVWVLDLERGSRTRISFLDSDSRDAIWSPDGEFLYFSSMADSRVFRVRSDGSAAAEMLEDAAGGPVLGTVTSISPDGVVLALHRMDPTRGNYDVFVHDLESRETATAVASDSFDGFPAISPNGRWLAYFSRESGGSEVYVRPFPDTGGRWQVSVDGGESPLWARDGTGIYFRDNAGIHFAEVSERGQGLSIGRPQLKFSASRLDYGSHISSRMFEVAPNGDVVMFAFAGSETEVEVRQMIVFNWFEELKRLVPVDR